MQQMVSCIEPSGKTEKSSIESVWKRAGALKRSLAGDWTNHLCIAVYHRLTISNHVNDVVGLSLRPAGRKVITVFSGVVGSLDITDAIAASMLTSLRSRHC